MTDEALSAQHARREALYASQLDGLPTELHPLLELLPGVPRMALVSLLHDLAHGTLASREQETGIALGYIFAAQLRGEIGQAETEALRAFVNGLRRRV
ncbi:MULTISPECIES: hypothetical protein [unclassified Pseudomonas]|uniref:hypothetical protein n=1 Tax=unclassified Pseudomonas TaxID=196821 RepID=UPI000A1DAB62|nr:MULTISPECIES: hypothetical protein [unclassified Pseudomonas]